MSTYSIALDYGAEARVSLSFSPMGTHAHCIIFEDDANVIAETSSRMYVDYCHAEIVASEIARALPVLADSAHEFVALAELYCECE